ncbi:MAG: glycine cleavage system protein GcvH [Planctomycetota bacterium]
MSSPTDLKYTDSHEWIRIEGDTVTLGITQHAVNELTDITYVEMKGAGEEIGAGDSVGEVESVKATSDIYSPIAGEVIGVNEGLDGDPSIVNNDPYGGGWLVKLRASDLGPADGLMDSSAYDEKYPLD